MIIDIHCHLWDENIPSKSWWDGFGSDWPGMRQVRHLNHVAWAKVIKQAQEKAKEKGVDFTEEEINGIMDDNAARLLELLQINLG